MKEDEKKDDEKKEEEAKKEEEKKEEEKKEEEKKEEIKKEEIKEEEKKEELELLKKLKNILVVMKSFILKTLKEKYFQQDLLIFSSLVTKNQKSLLKNIIL